MYETKQILKAISTLKECQLTGVTLAQATELLHKNYGFSFDDIWPAIMKLRQVSEKEAMRLTKEWCRY